MAYHAMIVLIAEVLHTVCSVAEYLELGAHKVEVLGSLGCKHDQKKHEMNGILPLQRTPIFDLSRSSLACGSLLEIISTGPL